MKRAIYSAVICLLVVFMSGFVLIGLEAKVEAQPKVVKLVMATPYTKSIVQDGPVFEAWVSEITNALKGRVEIRGVYGGTLVTPTTNLTSVKDRLIDIAGVVATYWPAQVPMTSSLCSVYDYNLGNKVDMRGHVAITEKLFNEFQEMRKEWENQNAVVLFWQTAPPFAILSTKPIKTLADLKGKKIRCHGNFIPKALEAVGAVGIPVSWGEIYTSLQTGVLDGSYTGPEAMYAAKFQEVARYLLVIGPKYGAYSCTCTYPYIMNKESLKQLSEADQRAFIKISESWSRKSGEILEAEIERILAGYKREGVTISHLTDEEVVKWAELCPKFYEETAKELNGKGLPGTNFIARYRNLANDYMSGRWKP